MAGTATSGATWQSDQLQRNECRGQLATEAIEVKDFWFWFLFFIYGGFVLNPCRGENIVDLRGLLCF